MKIPFKHYLHDDYNSSELIEYIYSQISDKFDGSEDDLAALIGDKRPFYEVELNCELDTETGTVTILALGELEA